MGGWVNGRISKAKYWSCSLKKLSHLLTAASYSRNPEGVKEWEMCQQGQPYLHGDISPKTDIANWPQHSCLQTQDLFSQFSSVVLQPSEKIQPTFCPKVSTLLRSWLHHFLPWDFGELLKLGFFSDVKPWDYMNAEVQSIPILWCCLSFMTQFIPPPWACPDHPHWK
jgi:hypothetical protein